VTSSCRGMKFEPWPTMFWQRTNRESDWRPPGNGSVMLSAAPSHEPTTHPYQNLALCVTCTKLLLKE
jgi:hypothetical protein